MVLFQYRNLSQGRRLIFRVAFDFLSIILVASGVFAIKYGSEPTHRGFFCDDESIRHPVLSDTIPMTVAAPLGILLPLALILVLEFSLRGKNGCIFSANKLNARNRSWFGATYNAWAVFIFGLTATQFLTEVGKFSVGRLRPHFLTLCDPDMTKLNCSVGYVTANVCTSTNTAKLKDARLSFPSGHSSFSMYCMMYLILYIQTRISCDTVILLKPVVQLVLFTMGFYTCLSRISDYKHHWSDVLAGAALGTSVCVCVILSLADFGQDLRNKMAVRGTEYEALVQSGSQTNGGSKSSYYDKPRTGSPPSASDV